MIPSGCALLRRELTMTINGESAACRRRGRVKTESHVGSRRHRVYAADPALAAADLVAIALKAPEDSGQKLPSARYYAGLAPRFPDNPGPTVTTCIYRLSRKSRSLGPSFLRHCWSPLFSSFSFLYLRSRGAGSSVQSSWLAPALHI